MNTWQNLIKTKMKSRNETQESLAEKMGVSQGSIAHWLSGRRKPDIEVVASLMKALQLDNFIFYNDGSASEQIQTSNCEDNANYVIEVLNVSASAGYGGASSDVKEVIKLVEYNEHEAMLLFGNIKAQNIKIINIAGDSMEPTFESGDSLFVDVSKTEFDSDGMYVFTYQESLFVKRLQKIGENLRVLSDNPLYENWGIAKENFDQIYIHGKVMFSQSMKLKRFG